MVFRGPELSSSMPITVLTGKLRHLAILPPTPVSHKFATVCSIALATLLTTILPSQLTAQTILADTAPGFDTGTTLTSVGATTIISDGEKEGGNLFHSFAEFDISTGDIAGYVRSSADAGSILNIVNRVRSGTASDIDGTMTVTDMPNADFFLANPNGLNFSATSIVNLPNSGIFTTAHEIRFGSGPTFSTITPDGSTYSNAAPATLGFLGGNGDINIDGLGGSSDVSFFGADVTVAGLVDFTGTAINLVAVGNGAAKYQHRLATGD